MARPINPNTRFQGKPCYFCGGTERYARDHKCVNCAAMRQREEHVKMTHPQHRLRESENKAARQIHDPTIGGAFPAGLARVMAGR